MNQKERIQHDINKKLAIIEYLVAKKKEVQEEIEFLEEILRATTDD